ncbi:unnamed protein product [Amoebophrya sp. A120]|nr:unnamed protein product [Amoebophrya sp. A120]|eukprot:GSA120T00015319001.1
MGHVRRVAVHAWRSFAYDVRVGRSSRWIVWRSRAPSIFLFSGGAVVGFLVVNRRGTRCANQVPCVERSSLRFDTAFRPDREIEFTHKLQRAASLLAPIQHHVYCWMQAEKDPDAAHKWLSLTSLPVCEMSHGQTPSRSELIESPRRNPDRIQQPKSRVRLPEDLDERKREESERTGNTSAARLAKMLTKMQKGDSSSQFDDRAIAAAGSGNYVRADGRAHEEELLEANVPAVLANHWVARGFLSQHFQHSPSLARVSVDSIKKAQGAVEWFAEQLLDEATWNRMVTQDKKLEGLLEGGIDNRTRSCRSQEGNDSRCLVDSNYPHYSYSFLKQTHDELERVGVVKVEALIPLQVIREIRRKLDIAPLRHSPYEKIQNDWREDVKAHGLTGAEKGTSSWLMSRGEDDETYLKDGPGGKSLQLYHVVAEFDCRRFDPQYILQFSYEKMRARVWQEKQTRRDRDCDYIDTSVDTDRIWERGPRRAVAEKCGSQEMMLPGGSVGSSIEANKSELPPEQRERMKKEQKQYRHPRPSVGNVRRDRGSMDGRLRPERREPCNPQFGNLHREKLLLHEEYSLRASCPADAYFLNAPCEHVLRDNWRRTNTVHFWDNLGRI